MFLRFLILLCKALFRPEDFLRESDRVASLLLENYASARQHARCSGLPHYRGEYAPYFTRAQSALSTLRLSLAVIIIVPSTGKLGFPGRAGATLDAALLDIVKTYDLRPDAGQGAPALGDVAHAS